MMEMLVKRISTHIEKLKAIKLSFDIQLLHPVFLSHILRFDHLSLRFLHRAIALPTASDESPSVAANISEFGKGPLFRLPVALPLSKPPPKGFKMLPEFFLEDICELFMHLIRFTPHLFDKSQSGFVDEIAGFATVLLMCRSSSASTDGERDGGERFIKNPYLISKWVEVLFALTWDFGDGTFVQQTLQGPFGTNPQVINYMARGLLAFYVGKLIFYEYLVLID
jgi:ubiquitin conjugation factor E4 B